jgi:predicted ATPase
VIGACAELADVLVRGCPNLALLATSREPLGIDGERVYRVPSLGVPADGADTRAIRAAEAVRLFEDRAAAQGVPLGQDAETAAVAGRICRRLDGIPLAIELAAARLRGTPAAELEARLDERFAILTGGSRAGLARQQTLRAMVDWSWELLNPDERAALAALSVFAGGFGLAAAEAVAAGPDVAPGEVTGLLGALVDKSLVQFDRTGTGPARYRLLETVRQYAAGQLDALGPAVAGAARIAHRDYYLALAEAAAPQLVRSDQAAWLHRLDAELGNLRAAIAFSQAQPDPAPGLRLAVSLRVYWRARGHAAEGADALRAPGRAGRPGGNAAARPGASRSGPPPPADGRLRDRRGLLPGSAGHCARRRGRLPGRRAAANTRCHPAAPRATRRRAAGHRAGPGPGPPSRGTLPDRPPAVRPGARRGR